MSQGGAFGGLLGLASCQGKLTAQGGERAESTLRPALCEDGKGGQGLKAGHRALSRRDLETGQGPDSAGGGDQPLMSVQAAQPSGGGRNALQLLSWGAGNRLDCEAS